MNQALDTHLSDVRLLAPSASPRLSALIPSVTPHPHVHNIVLFKPPKEDNTVHMGGGA